MRTHPSHLFPFREVLGGPHSLCTGHDCPGLSPSGGGREWGHLIHSLAVNFLRHHVRSLDGETDGGLRFSVPGTSKA